MKHVFIPREGDKELFFEKVDYFRKQSNEKLIKAYQREANIGITGVHAQALHLLALRKVMIERFGESPITFEDGCVIDLF